MQIIQCVDSTNNYAMALIKKGKISHGNSFFAMEQTHGKGRRGKEWKSNKGDNVILSIVSEMQWLPVSQQFHLSVAVALSCYDLITKYILANVSIKWPNDLFINDSKTGGILIENVIKGTLWQWSVIGIGLNINQESFDQFNLTATSFKLQNGKDFNVVNLAEELVEIVLKRIADLEAGAFSKMLEEYNQKLYAKNKMVKLKKDNEIFQTKVIGVSAAGQLITKDAFERRFNFDEVEFKGLVDE
ncbi:MAG TPA: biotin--[acetyl-CoA-carboxylase] ligase [Hanamia sp.]|nr:biotin--[acetyl-CoA-carboxylase] ligase [Hanamia sp.]